MQDQTQNPPKTQPQPSTSIDNFNFFELLGLGNLSNEQKELRMSEIEGLVFHGVLYEDLPKSLEEEDLKYLSTFETDGIDSGVIYEKFR